MTNLLDNLADKTENLDQCKGVAGAVAGLTSNPDQTSSSARVPNQFMQIFFINQLNNIIGLIFGSSLYLQASGGSAVNKSMNTMKDKFGNSNYDAVKDASASELNYIKTLFEIIIILSGKVPRILILISDGDP